MEPIFDEQGLILPTTISTMAGAWTKAEQNIREAHRLLLESDALLIAAFESNREHIRIDYDDLKFETPERLLDDLKKKAWSTIIDKTNLRKVMTEAKQSEMDDQLKHGDLPAITEANILAMLETNYANITQYAEDMVKEVYEWVRPHVNESRWNHDYKTNVKSSLLGLGNKIIIAWAVDRQYGRTEHPWRIHYSSENKFTALDNVFHILDGKGFVKTHHGPLYDSIYAAERNGAFETEYFKGRCYSNRNMHLQFKRLDLLQEFNRVAGGARLKSTRST